MSKTVAPWEIQRKLLVKAEEETDPRYGCKPVDRPIQDYIRLGIINLDKPSGPSSHEVTAWVKLLLKIRKAGHGGTLDPKVTGVLPVTLLDATKLVQSILVSGKEYVCVMRLHGDVVEDRLKKVLSEFEGKIYQRPPLRASVKHRLRVRTIYHLDYLEREEKNVLLRVVCQAGTYIRKLCHDMGLALGCGAHMRELRRTRSGALEEKDVVTLHDIAYYQAEYQETHDETYVHKFVHPVETALKHVPKIFIRDSAVSAICHGANLTAPGVLALETSIQPKHTVALLTQKGELVALAKALVSSRMLFEMDHGFAAKTKRVLMSRNLYPKMWQTGG
jgi:H/ACA ribonucleoprotein complex subunit 4